MPDHPSPERRPSTRKPEVIPVREALDWDSLEAYLRTHVDGVDGDFSVMQFPHGSANLTYQVKFGATTLVVRRPPFGRLARGAHDMKREYAVLDALHPHYSRAPRGLAFCEDDSVLGAPFLVSEYRTGVVIRDHIPTEVATGPDAGRRIGFAVTDALADLHTVDVSIPSIAALGRPDGYMQRQLDGWTARWDAVADPGLDVVGRAGQLLAESRPNQHRVAVIHNDFKPDNCQFSQGDPDRVTSVFDWDMATLGDPLFELGLLLCYWPDPEYGFNVIPDLANLDLPSKDEIVERYLSATRFIIDAGDLAWFEAFGCWRTAIVLRQLHDRFTRGESADERLAGYGENIEPLAQRALQLIAS